MFSSAPRPSRAPLRRARCSPILLFGCLSLSACLAPSTPDIEPAGTIPPVLSLLEADPPVTQILEVTRGDQQQFTIPFRSEEAPPDEVWGLRWVNYGLENDAALFTDTDVSDAGTFGQERLVDFTIPIDRQFAVGCQQFTLLITQRSNVDESQTPNVPFEPERVGLATWWLHVMPEIAEPGEPDPTLRDCPDIGE